MCNHAGCFVSHLCHHVLLAQLAHTGSAVLLLTIIFCRWVLSYFLGEGDVAMTNSIDYWPADEGCYKGLGIIMQMFHELRKRHLLIDIWFGTKLRYSQLVTFFQPVRVSEMWVWLWYSGPPVMWPLCQPIPLVMRLPKSGTRSHILV